VYRPQTEFPAPTQRFTARLLAYLRPTVLALGIFALGGTDAPQALATSGATTELSPTEREARVSTLVAKLIEHEHYRQSPVNDQVSALVLDRFLEQLDGQRSFFLASDIAQFERYRFRLDDAVMSGQLEPVFVIYNRLQQRRREQLTRAIESLKTEPNFEVEETFDFDRSKAPWAKSDEELADIWRRRIKADALPLLLANKKWSDDTDTNVSTTLRKRYESFLKRTQQDTTDDIFEGFMNAFAHVFDPHSNYFSPRNSEEYRIAMSLSYEGIGASLQSQDDYVTVMTLIPGGPALASGSLSVSDRIVAVGQGKNGKLVDVIGWRVEDVVQLIRGKINTLVRLQVLPAGATPGAQEKMVELTRNRIIMETSAAKKTLHKVQRGDREYKVGVIDVPSFYQDYESKTKGDANYRSTTRDVRRLINELKSEGVESLVMDLRGNGGGHLNEATGLTGLFIRKGPVVQLRATNGHIEVLPDEDDELTWDGPLIVLVDRFSASASEIFAAAIQDYGRGLIVGQQTYGKGTVQNLLPLERYTVGADAGFGQLTVTVGKYYRITGESTQHRGVQPDIVMPSAISSTEVGESAQDSALPWDRIHGVPFGRATPLRPAVPTLTQAHTRRIAADADFQMLVKDIELFETTRAQKAVSLNLKRRQAERTQLDEQRLTNENTRRKQLGLQTLTALTDLPTNEQRDPVLAATEQIAIDLDLWRKQGPTQARNASSTPAK
jgi:carboxyl-terminal processing protease